MIVLLAVGLGAAAFVWRSTERTAAVRQRADATESRVAAVLSGLVEFGSAQALYVAPGQTGGPWPARVSRILSRMSADAEALRGVVAPAQAETVVAAVGRLVTVDARVRDQLGKGDARGAADLLSNASRDAQDALAARVREVAASTRTEARAMEAEARLQQSAVVGSAALIWFVAALALARWPARASRPVEIGSTSATGNDPLDASLAEAPRDEASPPTDLALAAEVCAEIGRLSDRNMLATVLTRVAAVLDAPGAVIWLDSGGRLEPVASHGYPPGVVARLGSVERDAPNVTAWAWRDESLRTAIAEGGDTGAIVAPIVGRDGACGVLALEVRDGRERDPSACAVAQMLATQLAATVDLQAAPAVPVTASAKA